MSNDGEGATSPDSEPEIIIPPYRPKQDGKDLKIKINYEAKPGDSKPTVKKVELPDRSAFFVEIKIIRNHPDVIRIRSRLIPMEEIESFTITNPEDVKQNKEGKYIVEMTCKDKKYKLAEYFRPPSPVSS